MKNLIKFGFLGLALTIAFASCGGAETKTEQVADSTVNAIDSTVAAVDSTVAAVADSAKTAVDSVAKNAQ